MEMNFCRRCGSPLKNLHDHVYTCQNNHTIFGNANPAVGIFFVNSNGHIVLSVRGIEPKKGMLDVIGGFVDGEETFEHAIAREVKEELGLTESEYTPPEFLCSGIGHYPYQGEPLSVLTMLFWSYIKTERPLVPADDVAALHISPIEEIDPSKLHDDDVRVGLAKLRTLPLFNQSL